MTLIHLEGCREHIWEVLWTIIGGRRQITKKRCVICGTTNYGQVQVNEFSIKEK